MFCFTLSIPFPGKTFIMERKKFYNGYKSYLIVSVAAS